MRPPLILTAGAALLAATVHVGVVRRNLAAQVDRAEQQIATLPSLADLYLDLWPEYSGTLKQARADLRRANRVIAYLRTVSPAVQELAEIAFIQHGEEAVLKANANRFAPPLGVPASIWTRGDPTRLDLIAIAKGLPNRLDRPLVDFVRGTASGELEFTGHRKCGLPGTPMIPEGFSEARRLILEGVYVLGGDAPRQSSRPVPIAN